jgi:hypothetical protein
MGKCVSAEGMGWLVGDAGMPADGGYPFIHRVPVLVSEHAPFGFCRVAKLG